MTIACLAAVTVLALAWADEPIVLDSLEPIHGTVVDDAERPVEGVEVSTKFLMPWKLGSTVRTARTDADGRFVIDPPPGATPFDDWPALTNVWAFRPGSRPAHQPSAWLRSQPAPFRLVLRPAPGASILVLDPKGRPVPNARLSAAPFTFSPGDLPDHLTAETDGSGRAFLSDLAPEDVKCVWVAAPGHGNQIPLLTDGPNGAKLARLNPVGGLTGRVVADDPESVRGLTVRALTFGNPRISSQARTQTVGPDGRFEIHELTEGRVNVSLDLPAGSLLWTTSDSGDLAIEANKTAEVEIRVERGVLVHGVVRERGTNHPVQGARVRLTAEDRLQIVPTDASGRFEAVVPSGPILLKVVAGPYVLADELPTLIVPNGVESFELPPVEVRLGPVLVGTVRDAQGGPVADAEVAATALVVQAGRTVIRRLLTATDDQGAFRFEALPEDAEIWLTARRDDLASGPPVSARPDASARDPIALTVDRANTMSLGGRVVDERGRPLPNVRVSVIASPRTPDGRALDLHDVIADSSPFVTDSEGHFVPPRILRRDEYHYVAASIPGRLPQRSEVFAPTTPSFFEIVLPPEPNPAQHAVRTRLAEIEKARRQGDPQATRAAVLNLIGSINDPADLDDFELVRDLYGNLLELNQPAKVERLVRLDLESFGVDLDFHHDRNPCDQIHDLGILTAALIQQEKFAEARNVNDEAIALQEKIRPGHPYLAWLLLQRARILGHDGRTEDALKALDAAEARAVQVYGEPGRWLAEILHHRGWVLQESGRLDEAAAILSRAIDNGAATYGGNSPWLATTLERRAVILRKLGRDREAEADESRAHDIRHPTPPGPHA